MDDKAERAQLYQLILDGGLQVPGFDHWRERSTWKPSDPGPVRWVCACGFIDSPDAVKRHWTAMIQVAGEPTP